MVFIGDIGNKQLSERLGSIFNFSVVYPEVTIFPDGEQRVFVNDQIGGQDVVVLKSLSAPVDSNIIQFLFILNALKESGANQVTAIVPYLGYSRADHTFRVGEAASLHVVIDAIERGGVDKIILLDLHSIKIPELFSIPVTDLSALPLFAEKIKSLGLNLDETLVVTPDMGGVRRIKLISEMLGTEYGMIEKNRDIETGEISITKMHGEKPKKTVCIVDDMISSGGTMVQAIKAYFEQGVKEIYAFATHPVFSDDAPNLLQTSPVKKVFVTDSIDIPKDKQFEKLEILSVSDLFAQSLKA